MRVRTYRTLLFIFLFITIIFGALFRVQADQQTEEGSQTTIGEPVKDTIPAKEENLPPPTFDNEIRVTGAEADNFTYLPIVAKLLLGPEEQAVVDLVNQRRSQAGCAPLLVSPQLTLAAKGHSKDMALNDFFSHTSSDGRSPWDRIRATGYDYSSAAENIAAGYSTAGSAVSAWMNSSGHRANILNCGLKETGVGYYYLGNDTGRVNYHHYWTQVFASP